MPLKRPQKFNCRFPQLFSVSTLIKNKIKFSSYIRKFRGMGCKVVYVKRPPHIWGKYCAFPHVLESPSYMTLHLIPSEFPYI